jgi:hypothetical protein
MMFITKGVKVGLLGFKKVMDIFPMVLANYPFIGKMVTVVRLIRPKLTAILVGE